MTGSDQVDWTGLTSGQSRLAQSCCLWMGGQLGWAVGPIPSLRASGSAQPAAAARRPVALAKRTSFSGHNHKSLFNITKMPFIPATSAFAWKAGAGLGQPPPHISAQTGSRLVKHGTNLHLGPTLNSQSRLESRPVHSERTLWHLGWETRRRPGRWRPTTSPSTASLSSPSASTQSTRGGKHTPPLSHVWIGSLGD